MFIEPELIDSVRAHHLAAKERVVALQKEKTDAVRKEKFWGELHDYLDKGWHEHVLHLMHAKRDLIEGLCAEGHGALSELEAIGRKANEAAEAARRDFPAMLEHACREASLEIDDQSRHPIYYSAKKFLKLNINEEKQVAILSDPEVRLGDCPSDVQAIVGMLQKEMARLFERKFDGKNFLDKVRKNYLAILKKEKKQDGAAIPIRQITRRMQKNLKRFRSDEFLVDLSRLVESGPLEIDGRRLDLQQTRDTSQGMLLYGAAGGGYVGYVTFREISP